ncbi:cell division protein FtsB [Thiolapillus sp.]|uniref:cell division protein FtsB n=2 Tax=Thiolapillus sp. TaxID=2017437 RepID=UPI002738AFE9|nr:cell division protein FtsB [Thiolapillus sp.]
MPAGEPSPWPDDLMPWYFRLLFVILLAMFVVLQYRLWVGQGSMAEVYRLQQQIDRQKQQLAEMKERNVRLRAEVQSLKTGLEAVEARARTDLGMIKEGETFFQVIEPEIATRP